MIKEYSRELYDKEVIFKAAYSFTDKYYIHMDVNKESYCIEIIEKKPTGEDVYALFENELIAQQTRKIIAEKTKNIRELITARALASTLVCNYSDDSESENEEDISEGVLDDWFKNA